MLRIHIKCHPALRLEKLLLRKLFETDGAADLLLLKRADVDFEVT